MQSLPTSRPAPLAALGVLALLSFACGDGSPVAPEGESPSAPSLSLTGEDGSTAGGPYAGVEGTPVEFAVTDPDAALSYEWNFGDGGSASGATPSHTYQNDGSYTVTLTISDGESTSTDETTAEIANADPVVESVSGPTDPVAVNTNVSVTATFSDPGALDEHTALIEWGDGGSSVADVTEAEGAGTASAGHTYKTAGIYTVEALVEDDAGGAGTGRFEYVTVYNPDGEWVAGSGAIESPEGACTWSGCAEDGSTTGLATFGFFSKYQSGATTPSGNTRFRFRAGALDFRSTEYEWLVVSGPRAQYKGSGEINDGGDYGFLLTAIDGDVSGGGGIDRFRIKIWDRATEEVVYDNEREASEDSDPTTALTRGKIRIQKSGQNTAPAVTITSPADGATFVEETEITFTAEATDLEDGDVGESVSWTSDIDGALGTGESNSVVLTTGTHTITATATDSKDLTDSSVITVIVNALPVVAITSPADAATVDEGVEVAFEGTASDAEDGDLGAALVWTSDLDGEIGTGPSFTRGDLSIGTHEIQAAATDSDGATGTASIALTVENVPPVVSITSPADGASVTEGAQVDFVGTASDAGEDISESIEWESSLDGSLGSGSTLSTTGLSVGTHTITASVTDPDDPGVTSSALITLVVEALGSQGAALNWELLLGPLADPQIALLDVHAIAHDDVYAVGHNCSRRTVLHWDGASWTPQPLETMCPQGVWASASDDVFVVGLAGRIRHFDGTSWTEHSTEVTAHLRDAWGSSPSDVWAVGDGVILHYDGNAAGEWTTELTSADVDCCLRLFSVWGSSSTDVYAVTSGRIWHYDGAEWSPVSTGLNLGGISRVWGSGPDDVFVVGQFARIFHWDGSSWSQQSAPAELQNEFLFGVSGTASNDVYAVGVHGTIIHYDGSSWSRVLAGGPHLHGVSGVPGGGAFAVGNLATIFESDGGDWKVHSTGQSLRSVWAVASDDVFVTAPSSLTGSGMLLHFDGVDWTVQNPNLTGSELGNSTFLGVWGTSSSDVWAVGGIGFAGVVMHYDGVSWSRVLQLPTGTILSSVWGTGSDDVFAVGGSGTIIHYDGVSWTEQPSGTTVRLRDVWGVAENQVWAVGSSGTILHYDGIEWTPQASGTTATLRGVWAAAPDRVFVVAQSFGGEAFHYDGVEWTAHDFDHQGFEIWGASTIDVFAAASADDVMHWDGTSWTAQDTPGQLPCCVNILFGISGVSATEVYAVGGLGFIVRGTP